MQQLFCRSSLIFVFSLLQRGDFWHQRVGRESELGQWSGARLYLSHHSSLGENLFSVALT
jgi:hypothetical protein